MKWLIDTSARGRQDHPDVAAQIAAVLVEDPSNELMLSPSVLLELLVGPQGDDVADEHTALREEMLVAEIDDATIDIAARAMETLAKHSDEGHRLPVADLITAALAHQRGYGIIHIDEHFEQLAQHAGLEFRTRPLTVPNPTGGNPAARQRALIKQLRQELHHLPIADAEALLADAVARARARRSQP